MVRFGEHTVTSHFIDKKGNYIISREEGGKHSFSEGLAAADTYFEDLGEFWELKAYKTGYINKKNEMVISEIFDDAGDFSEGLAPVCIGNKWGYIDKNGKYQIALTYQDA